MHCGFLCGKKDYFDVKIVRIKMKMSVKNKSIGNVVNKGNRY